MFTINIKGKANPKDPKMVKLEMIIFKTGYARVTKVLNVSGPVKDWDNQAQAFKGNGSTLTVKNKILFELKNQYQKVAEDWDYEGRVWSPVELSHCFDEVQTRKEEVKSLSVLQMTDSLIEKFTHKERHKNGQIITSINNTRSYKEIKNSLSRFTQEVYNRSLSSYYFKEINERFLLDYTLYVQKIGIENGNKGGLTQKLRRVFREANADTSIFNEVKIPVKLEDEPLLMDHTAIERIEFMNRGKLTEKEGFYIELFLFGYYTSGSTINEMASLKTSSIKKGYLYCKRNASENIAIMPLCSDALHIIDKYQSMCFDDYLLPIFTHKHDSPEQQLGRIKRISELTNQTLRKVSKMLKLENAITMGMAKSIFIEHLLFNEVPYEKVAQYLGCSIETVLRYSEKMRQNYGE